MRSYGGLLEPRGSSLTTLKSTFNAEHFIRRLSWSILNGFGETIKIYVGLSVYKKASVSGDLAPCSPRSLNFKYATAHGADQFSERQRRKLTFGFGLGFPHHLAAYEAPYTTGYDLAQCRALASARQRRAVVRSDVVTCQESFFLFLLVHRRKLAAVVKKMAGSIL